MTTVDLRAVINAMDLPSPTWEAYLDTDSGDIVTVTDDDRSAIDHGAADGPTTWQAGALPRVRDALESDHYLLLPDQYDIHEWSIMKRFAMTQRNRDLRQDLLEAVHGNGAFRRFSEVLGQHGLQESWREFRSRSVEHLACDWLNRHHIRWR